MSFRERYNKLNKDQKSAVNHTEGPLLVIAGPGSGKTELLGIRVGNILKKTDVPPESILCLTYTDAASSGMKERLIELVGEDGYKVPTHTFHGFCKKIMESYPEYFFKGALFNVADDATRTGILESILSELEHDNPLSVVHPKKGYIHLEGVKEGVTRLKESGLTVSEFKKVVEENKKFLEKTQGKIDNIFSQRVSKETVAEIELFIVDLRKEKKFAVGHVKSLAHIIADSLELAIEGGSTEKISRWKRVWTKKDQEKRILKNLSDIEKMESMADIYEKYKAKMYEEGYYEFLDMLLDVAVEMENNESLRDELREKYLYFLVDEFQDTNGIQMRILNLLIEDERDRLPNICVVGDDDQAIYRFQGAEISNILGFRESYPDAKVVTLLKNYRSKQKIIELARNVILKGGERLENLLKEVNKDLVSQTGKGKEVFLRSFNTKEEEYTFVARKVKRIISEGKDPGEIAIIGRTHKSLQEIRPFFSYLNIPTYSERKENVLEKEHVRQIITIVKFASLCLEGDKKSSEELLPEILSFPFWELKREKIMEVSSKAYLERKSWLTCMKEDGELKHIADFLIDISLKAKNKSLEEIVDIVIGTKRGYLESPFKKFHFSKERLENESNSYLDLLSSLRCFIKAVRTYKAGKFTKAKDLTYFLELYKKNNISLLNKDPLISQEGVVSLITAHNAKGKEFDTVFVLNCQREEWGVTKGRRKISLPANIPFRKAGDEDDDRLRLFYVALTRAKNFLYPVCYKKEEDGKNVTPLEFLSGIKSKERKEKVCEESFRSAFLSFYTSPFHRKERDFLFSLVKKHKLSATGINKFLNVTDEGPQSFLEENILHFPEKKALPLSYGTAVHSVINEIYVELKKKGKLLNEKRIIEIFENYLRKERLSEKDFSKLLKQGKQEITLFYKAKRKEFSADHIIEKNFRNEDCLVGGVEITGKIDKIIKDENRIKVADFKTGNSLFDWKGKNEYEKVKAWKYKNQLIFYKFLVENSKEFKGKYFVESGYLEFIRPTKEKEVITLPLEFKKEDEERMEALIKVVANKIGKLDFPSVEKYKKGTVKEIAQFENDLLCGRL